MYICEHSHFNAYMKIFKEKLFMLRMIEFLLLLSSLQRRRSATTDDQLTANNRDDCLAFILGRLPAISTLIPQPN